MTKLAPGAHDTLRVLLKRHDVGDHWTDTSTGTGERTVSGRSAAALVDRKLAEGQLFDGWRWRVRLTPDGITEARAHADCRWHAGPGRHRCTPTYPAKS